jgi:DNA topoisomerase-1
VVDFKFTAKVEADFDAIAEGKQDWNAMIKSFYGGFHETVEAAGGISREEASSQRELGKDPKSGKPVIARVGRFGPMVQIGVAEDEEKPSFASIPEGVAIDEVTLEQALKMFEFPRNLGQYEGEDVLVNTGRFGPYVKCGKTNASLKKNTIDDDGNEVLGDDPHSVDLARATELLLEKREIDKNKFIGEWPEKEIQLLRGPYGIYIKHGKKNVRIPKDVEKPEELKIEEIEKIIKEAPAAKGRKFTKKK